MLFVWNDHYIAIGHQSPAAIDNVVFRHISCQTPSNLDITPYDDSVYVSWLPNGDESLWIVTCDTLSMMVQNPHVTITGLDANSDYQLSVRAFCIEGDTSMAAVGNFHTTCHPVELPFSENFDALTSSTTPFTAYFPVCWSETVIGTQGNRNAQLYYNSEFAHSGNYSLYMGKEAYVALPPMPVPLSELELSFSHLVNNADFGFEVGVLEGSSFISLASYSDPEETYVEHTLSFSNYQGSSRIIAFHNTNPISIGCPNFIDDIMVDYLPECLPVTDISAPVISTDVIYLDWVSPSPALSWIVEYGVSGFQQGTGDTLTAFTHPVAIEGLDTMTSYDFYLKSYCGDSSYSDWVGPVQFSTAYCADATSFSNGFSNISSQYLPLSTGFRYSATEFIIDSAELSGLGDISAIAFYYADTAAMTVKDNVTIWLQPTSVVSFSNDNSFIPLNSSAVQVYSGALNCHKGWNFFSIEEGFVWDGVSNLVVIVDDNSNVYELYDPKFNLAQCSGYKSISYRSMLNDVDPSNPSAFYGTKSRYNSRPVMQLISCGGASCHEPVDLMATNIAWDSVTVAWHGSTADFEIANKKSSDTSWSDAVSVSSASNYGTFTFSALDELTDYDFRVRQLCVTGNLSEWAEASFTTAMRPCLAPSELSVVEVSYDQVTIDWYSPNPSALFHLRLNDGAADTLILALQHPFTITGLANGFSYSVAVADSCINNGSISEFSEELNFTTLSCDAVTNVMVSDVTATSALLSWEGNASAYVVEYGLGNFSTGTGTLVDDVTDDHLLISELLPDNDYSVYVKAKCGDASYSLWSEQLTFHTSTQGIVNPQPSDCNSSLGCQLSISPNPARESATIAVTIYIPSSGLANLQLSIVDICGRTRLSRNISDPAASASSATSSRLTFDVDNLPAGTYFVRLANDHVNIVRKLVIK